ncbi:glycosyltransferase involved in cell wall biosynthesis [Novosphingobium chloroacetimidivorans]|uniref:Glycosyltransferase involved in cell wall biosynthesis n=1 Tax=Novosphingobium chloroacetimidivorans TaxID=1428314 RepID=A0A7W7KAP3_9SPHN|nr:glycosyltransferase family 4 protein [Novosphingobium chloroacetimidivorans]MBB4859334.1 glycosyltransferase involved in cell wall biosynthesis [Novosphingobium chloroacetimidivorans]
MSRRVTRLLMTVDAVGGVWQYATELACALRPLGFETVLAVLGPPPTPEQRTAIKRCKGVTLVETGLPLDWMSEAASTRRAAAELAALARREKVDLVHLNSPALAAGQAWPAPVVAVAHGCLASWWDAARSGQPLDPAFAWHREMMAQALRTCDRVIAPSVSFAETLRRVYGLAVAPQVVHNGRALPARVRATAGTNSALTAGRMWDEVKNLATLDKAAALVPFPFHAAGTTTAPHGEVATADHLHLLGQLDAAAFAAKLEQRPVFVSAATFEPFGLAVLEAAGARCPLVLSDIPTFRELWDGAVVFVDPLDAAGFAAAIEAIIRDPDHRDALGEAAQARAQRYVPERMANAMAEHYRDLMAARLAA